MLKINHLSKQFAGNEFYSLKDVSLEINKGEIVGLIGKNGAGKSTLMKLMAKSLKPSSGTITYKGTDIFSQDNLLADFGIMIDPVTDIAASLNELTEFHAVSKRLVELLELNKEEQVDTELVDAASIQLENVRFSYHTDPVLNGVSVRIPEGAHVAIVGPSGAGKSTIFSLLMKYYQDYQGEIRIGQQCLSDISTKEMRRLISFIPQDNTLFHGTIRENLLYGKNESVSEERIAYILKELGLSPLVAELEDGLDTRISENGTGLSEGQKQRFSIARALLLEHPIYLLDEATASLDTVTERVISKAIDRLTAGKTRLTIAHRLHTVREADGILVLDKNGQVADYGHHQQLVERNHLYQDFLRGLPQAS